MCGRFTQHYTWAEIHKFLNVFGAPKNLQPRYNIGPTTSVNVVRNTANGRELINMRWGLVPSFWKKSLKEVPATFNARVETVATKPMFRAAYKSKRCIIPASGFYEWTGEKGDKEPHFFSAADGSPVMCFAGLWESWLNSETGEDVLSCTILVSDASAWMKAYHDRMPIILSGDNIDAWLNNRMTAEQLISASDTALREWVVSRDINKTGAQDDNATSISAVVTDVLAQQTPLFRS